MMTELPRSLEVSEGRGERGGEDNAGEGARGPAEGARGELEGLAEEGEVVVVPSDGLPR